MKRWVVKYSYEVLAVIVYPIGALVGYTKAEDTYLSWDALANAATSLLIFSLVMTCVVQIRKVWK